MYKREMKIVLKDESDKNVAKTYFNGSEWWFIGAVGRWCDTPEEAFNYEFCEDAHYGLHYEALKDEVLCNISEIEEAYLNGEKEVEFYF